MDECQLCNEGEVSASTGDGVEHHWQCPDCGGTGRITRQELLKQNDGIQSLHMAMLRTEL